MTVLRNSECYLKWEFKRFKEATSIPSKSIRWSCLTLTVKACASFAKLGSCDDEAFFWQVDTAFCQRCERSGPGAVIRLCQHQLCCIPAVAIWLCVEAQLGALPTGNTHGRKRRPAGGRSSSYFPASWRRLCIIKGGLFFKYCYQRGSWGGQLGLCKGRRCGHFQRETWSFEQNC